MLWVLSIWTLIPESLTLEIFRDISGQKTLILFWDRKVTRFFFFFPLLSDENKKKKSLISGAMKNKVKWLCECTLASGVKWSLSGRKICAELEWHLMI